MAESYIVEASSGMDVNVVNDVIQIDESLFGEADEEVTVTLTYTIDNQEGCAKTVTRPIVVARPPQPSFEGVLSPVGDNEHFRVALSNIQPENGERYILRALFSRPDGDDLIEENEVTPSNPEVVLSYGLVGPDLQVRLQLIVERSGCEGESEVIPYDVPIFIVGFQMLGLADSGSDGGGLIGTGFIEDGQEFFISDFNQFGGIEALFNIRAVTVPAVIGSVRFYLTLGEGDTSTPVSKNLSLQAGNYRAIESKPFGFPLAVGKYTLKASTYYKSTGTRAEGASSTIIFYIKPDQVNDPQPSDSNVGVFGDSLRTRGFSPAESGLDLLRSRAAAQKAEMEELGQAKKLTSTKAYGLSSVFLSFMGAADALTARYEEAVATIVGNIKRAKEDRKEDYQQLLNILTRNYLDKLVAAGPAEMPEVAREALKAAVAQAKEAGMKMAQVRKDWNGAELKKNLEAAAVDKYNRLLR